MRRTGPKLLALLAAAAMIAAPVSGASIRAMSSAQSDYVEHCGGCHGIQGSSYPARVPPLRNRVGHFLCTAQGRAYLLRVPNVSLSSADDEQLAQIMNFVVFGLGGASADPQAPRFTATEVAENRGHTLAGGSLIAERARLVKAIARRCRLPKDALRF